MGMQAQDVEYIRGVVAGEHEVQVEDLGLCEGVQAGLKGPAYDVGRCRSCLQRRHPGQASLYDPQLCISELCWNLVGHWCQHACPGCSTCTLSTCKIVI